MISITKKILWAALILLCPLYTPIKAIDDNVARNIAVASGIFVGGASGLLSNYLTNKNIASKIASPIIGITLGGLTKHLIHQWLYTKTPSTRIAYAKDFVQKASDSMQAAQQSLIDEIITKNFASDELLITYITKRFATDWPLVSARNFLIDLPNNLKRQENSIRYQLNNAQFSLELAMNEMKKNNNKYAALLQEGNHLQEKIKNIEENCAQYNENLTLIKPVIENLINTISLFPQFTLQAILHETHIQHTIIHRQQYDSQPLYQAYLSNILLSNMLLLHR